MTDYRKSKSPASAPGQSPGGHLTKQEEDARRAALIKLAQQQRDLESKNGETDAQPPHGRKDG
jgi:hypothetical protein